MPITAADVIVRFREQGAQDVKREVKEVGNTLDQTANRLAKFGAGFTAAVTAPVLAGFKQMYSGAASLEQAQGKVDTVFGDSAGIVRDWAKTTADAFGISETEALQSSGAFGLLFDKIGAGNAVSARMSQDLVGLTADMSAFNDISSETAQMALFSGLTGEYESLKRLGIFLNAATVDQEALNIAIADGRSEITEADKIQARYNLIMEESAIQQGQFGKEADTASGAMARFRSKLSDLTAGYGQYLLPAGTAATEMLIGFLGVLEDLSPAMQMTVLAIAAGAAAVGPLLIALSAVIKAYAGVKGAMGGFSVAKLAAAHPVLLGILATVGVLTLAYRTNFLGFADWVDGVWDGVQRFVGAFRDVWNAADDVTVMFGDFALVLDSTTEKVNTVSRFLAAMAAGFTALGMDRLAGWFTTAAETVDSLLASFQLFRDLGLDPVSAALAALGLTFPVLSGVMTDLLGVVGGLTGAFSAFMAGDWRTGFAELGNAASAAWDAVREGGALLADWVLDVGVPTVTGWIVDAAGDVWGALKAAAGWVWDGATELGAWALDTAVPVVGGWVSDATADIWGALKTAVGWAILFAGDLGAWVLNTAAPVVGGWISNAAGKIWPYLQAAAGWVWDRAVDLGHWTLETAVPTVSGWIKDATASVWPSIKSAAKWSWDGIADLGVWTLDTATPTVTGWITAAASDAWGLIRRAAGWTTALVGEIPSWNLNLSEPAINATRSIQDSIGGWVDAEYAKYVAAGIAEPIGPINLEITGYQVEPNTAAFENEMARASGVIEESSAPEDEGYKAGFTAVTKFLGGITKGWDWVFGTGGAGGGAGGGGGGGSGLVNLTKSILGGAGSIVLTISGAFRGVVDAIIADLESADGGLFQRVVDFVVDDFKGMGESIAQGVRGFNNMFGPGSPLDTALDAIWEAPAKLLQAGWDELWNGDHFDIPHITIADYLPDISFNLEDIPGYSAAASAAEEAWQLISDPVGWARDKFGGGGDGGGAAGSTGATSSPINGRVFSGSGGGGAGEDQSYRQGVESAGPGGMFAPLRESITRDLDAIRNEVIVPKTAEWGTALSTNLVPLAGIAGTAFSGVSGAAGIHMGATATTVLMRATEAQTGLTGRFAAMDTSARTSTGGILATTMTNMDASKASIVNRAAEAASAHGIQMGGMRQGNALAMASVALTTATKANEAKTALVSRTREGVDSSGAQFSRLAGIVRTQGGAAVGAASTLGTNIGNTLATTLDLMYGRVSRAAGRLAGAAASAMFAALQVSSPSRVAMYIGEMTGEGLALGLERLVPKVAGVATSMVGELTGIVETGVATLNRVLASALSGPTMDFGNLLPRAQELMRLTAGTAQQYLGDVLSQGEWGSDGLGRIPAHLRGMAQQLGREMEAALAGYSREGIDPRKTMAFVNQLEATGLNMGRVIDGWKQLGDGSVDWINTLTGEMRRWLKYRGTNFNAVPLGTGSIQLADTAKALGKVWHNDLEAYGRNLIAPSSPIPTTPTYSTAAPPVNVTVQAPPAQAPRVYLVTDVRWVERVMRAVGTVEVIDSAAEFDAVFGRA